MITNEKGGGMQTIDLSKSDIPVTAIKDMVKMLYCFSIETVTDTTLPGTVHLCRAAGYFAVSQLPEICDEAFHRNFDTFCWDDDHVLGVVQALYHDDRATCHPLRSYFCQLIANLSAEDPDDGLNESTIRAIFSVPDFGVDLALGLIDVIVAGRRMIAAECHQKTD